MNRTMGLAMWVASLAMVLGTIGCGDSTTAVADARVDSRRDRGADLPLADSSVDRGVDQASDIAIADGPGSDGDTPDAAAADVGVDAAAGDTGIAPDVGSSGQREYVADDLLLPKSPTEAQLYGYDYDNNGVIDNALGAIISALAASFSGVSFSDQVSLAVAQGSTLPLMRVHATSFVNHTGTTADFSWATPVSCCTSLLLASCRAQAASTCFSGSASFTPVGAATTVNGSITASVGTFTASSLPLRLVFGGAPLNVVLSSARISGRFVGNTIVDGKITGGLSQTEINSKLVPALATMLDTIVKDPTTTAATRQQIILLFDSNSDGSISTSELATNALIQTFFAGDVDVDNDGKLDLSVGLGFTAVGCLIL